MSRVLFSPRDPTASPAPTIPRRRITTPPAGVRMDTRRHARVSHQLAPRRRRPSFVVRRRLKPLGNLPARCGNSKLNVWPWYSNFNYTCLASGTRTQPSLGCTTTWTAALAVLGVTVVTDGKVGTSTVVSETANGITAYGIQIRFKAGDPTPAPTTGDSVSPIQAKNE